MRYRMRRGQLCAIGLRHQKWLPFLMEYKYVKQGVDDAEPKLFFNYCHHADADLSNVAAIFSYQYNLERWSLNPACTCA